MFPPERFGWPEIERCSFAPGERLVLFTDGATELQLESGEELGLFGLEQILADGAAAQASKVASELVERLVALGNGSLEDDVLVVCVDFQS